MDEEASHRELDGLRRTVEGAHNRINALVSAAADAMSLRALVEQLQRQIEGAHNRLNEMSEALYQARRDAELAREQAARAEAQFQGLTERLRQEGADLGREALRLVERVLTASPPTSGLGVGHAQESGQAAGSVRAVRQVSSRKAAENGSRSGTA